MKKAIGGMVLIFIAGIAIKGVGVFPVLIVGLIATAVAWQVKDLQKCAEKNKKLLGHSKRIKGVIDAGYKVAEPVLEKIKEENTPATWENLHARFLCVDLCYTESKLHEASALMELAPLWTAHKAHKLLNEFTSETSDYLALFGEIRGFSDKMESLKKEISKFLASIDVEIISMRETAGEFSEEQQKEFAHTVRQFEETRKLLAENKQIDRAAASARLREISVMLKKIEKGAHTIPKKVGTVIPLSKKTS